MNTERPDHDDAARETDGAAEPVTKGSPGQGSAGEEQAAPVERETSAGEAGPPEGEADAVPGEPEDGTPPAAERDDAGAPPAAERDDAGAPPAPEPDEAAPPVAAEPGRDSDAPAEPDGDTTSGSASAAGRPGETSPAAARPADPADAPAGRHRSRLMVGMVAVAVMVVGGGGAYLAAGAGGGGGHGGVGAPSAQGTPPVLALDGYAAGAGESGNGIAPGEPNPYGVVYEADGTLPEGPESAVVRWARGEVGKDAVARLAKALGVTGTPVAAGDVWRVGGDGGDRDGSGPVLRVNRQAPGMWTFSRYAPGSDNCSRKATACPAEPSLAQGGDPIGESAAIAAAAPVLKAVGQDDAKVDASQVMGAERVVNADPVFGGLPTYGWTTGVIVDARGEVVGGNGRLTEPVAGAAYPVLSARETLDLMNSAPGTEHRMGIGGCASAVPQEDRLESPCGRSGGGPHRETVTVEGAVLGLAPRSSGGRPVLVPSWLFTARTQGAAETYTVTHPAVDPAYLAPATASATPPPGVPTAPPSPRPTGPGAGSTAPDGTRTVDVEAYTADGSELTVRFTAGVCADYTVSAAESADRVAVTVTAKPWPDKVCIMIAKTYHRTVRLDRPLGDRTVVGADGQEVPLEKPGARLPETADPPR
ncbi:hypothetical protein [Streptomyces sp. bgisy159]|uniref:hypothetical protein n=1 Tax=Streptomyces sp. bgisy159 TaxID=3413795 RepID=UPI003F49FDBF